MPKLLKVLALLLLLCLLPSMASAATYIYDDLGRLIAVTYNNGQKITYKYDAGGNILGSSDEAPVVVATEPQDSSIEVPLEKTLTVSFSHDIRAGENFDNITVQDVYDNSVLFTKSINKNKLVLDPNEYLGRDKQYTVTIPAGALKDQWANNSVAYTFSFNTQSNWGYVASTQDEWLQETLDRATVTAAGDLELASNNGLKFDGLNDNVSCSSITQYNLNTYSVEAKIIVNPTATGIMKILYKGDRNSKEPISFYVGDDGRLVIEYYNSGTNYYAIGTSNLKDGKEHHVAGVRDYSAGQMKVYVDGVLEKSITSGTNTCTVTNPLYIGSRTTDQYFKGEIREVRLWNCVRTDAEIAANKDKTLIGTETGLAGYWRLGEGTGSTVNDDSVNNNDGTIAGASWVVAKHTLGNCTSRTMDLSAGGSGKTLHISWNDTIPNGTGVNVKTRVSLDGGVQWSEWREAVNGDMVEGITSATDLSNALLMYQITLSSNNVTITPQVHDIRIESIADDSAPIISETSPANNSVNALTENPVTITFSENIQAGDNYSGISLKAGETVVDFTPSITGRALTIEPTNNLNYDTNYTVTIPAGAIKDMIGKPLASGYTLSFTTKLNWNYKVDTQTEWQQEALDKLTATTAGDIELANKTGLKFDGVNDNVSCPSITQYNLNTYTVEAKIKVDPTATGLMKILYKGNGTNQEPVSLYVNADGYLVLEYYKTGYNYYAVGTTNLKDGIEHHVAGVKDYNSGQMKVYVDGVLEKTVTAGTNTCTVTNPLYIGSRVSDHYFKGEIREVRLWNCVRTDAEIAANKDESLSGSETGLIGYWKMDECTGTSVNDATVNNNDGTINGAAWIGRQLTGTCTSGAIDLSTLGTGNTLKVSWNGITPVSTGIAVKTRVSLDDGATWGEWRDVTNGGLIQDITSGTDLSTARLMYKITLSTSDGNATPQVHDLKIEAISDNAAPTISETTPVNDAVNVLVENPVTITFSEDIQAGDNYSSISLKAGETVVDFTPSITGRTLTIEPTNNLNYDTNYTVTIPAGAIKDMMGKPLASGYTLSFTTKSNWNYKVDTQTEWQQESLDKLTATTAGDIELANKTGLKFDGVNDNVSCPSITQYNLNTYTVEAKIKVDPTATGLMKILYKGNGTNQEPVSLYVNADGYLVLEYYKTGYNYYAVGTTNLKDGIEHHVAGVRDYNSGQMKVYVDGVLEKTATSGTNTCTVANPLYIGSRVSDHYFKGEIREVRLWNCVRTDAEIAANKDESLSGSETGLIGYWKMDECTGTLVNDATINNNDGTINGAAWIGRQLTGTCTSGAIDLSTLGTGNTLEVSWNVTIPESTGITVKTRVSLDGGTTWGEWSEATNGGLVQDITSGTDLSNARLMYQVTLSTSDAVITPQMHDLLIEAVST